MEDNPFMPKTSYHSLHIIEHDILNTARMHQKIIKSKDAAILEDLDVNSLVKEKEQVLFNLCKTAQSMFIDLKSDFEKNLINQAKYCDKLKIFKNLFESPINIETGNDAWNPKEILAEIKRFIPTKAVIA